MAKRPTRPTLAQTFARPLHVRPSLPSGGRFTEGGLMTTFAGNPERAERPEHDRENPNFDAGGRKHEEPDRKPRYEIELLVRTYFGDVGVRPTTDPNLVFWESPDIWIDGPSGDPDQATPGVTNTVNVHVWNVGLADCWSAHVDLYWCDPSVGVAPAFAHPIGSTVVSLMGGEHKIVPFPWVPTFANGGHECLVAQVYNPVSDPLVAPFNPTLDRHVCQRNISVLTVAAGKAFEFIVSLPNLSQLSATAVLDAQLLSGQSRQQFFKTIGAAEAIPISRSATLGITPRVLRLAPARERGAPAARNFREVLEPEPSRVARRHVDGALRARSAPQGRARRPLAALAPTSVVSARVDAGKPEFTRALTLEPESVLQVAVQGRLPQVVRASGRDVYRVTERVGGRITGGVTVIVKPPQAKPSKVGARSTAARRARTKPKRR